MTTDVSPTSVQSSSADSPVLKVKKPKSSQPRAQPLDPAQLYGPKWLQFGFAIGLLLSFLCFLGAGFYLFFYLNSLTGAKAATSNYELVDHLLTARLGLISCGITAGMALAFLGFALFLLGINTGFDSRVRGQGFDLNFQKMAPGVFIIFFSTVLIGLCVTRTLNVTGGEPDTPFAAKDQQRGLSPDDMKQLDDIRNGGSPAKDNKSAHQGSTTFNDSSTQPQDQLIENNMSQSPFHETDAVGPRFTQYDTGNKLIMVDATTEPQNIHQEYVRAKGVEAILADSIKKVATGQGPAASARATPPPQLAQ